MKLTNHLYYSLTTFLILLIGTSSCNNSKKESTTDTSTDSKELKGTISLSGAFALYPLANVWAQEFHKEHPGVRFNVSAGGAGKGMADVLVGAVDLGMFSREITQIEKDKGVWWVSVTKDAVVPTISSKNPILAQLKTEGLKREELAHYFLQDGRKTWKNTAYEVNVFTRSDAAGAADTWAQYLGAAGQDGLKGIAVFGDPGLADAVKKDARAIGFNNIIYIYDLNSGKKYPGIDVVPIDVNENGKIDPEENFYDTMNEMTDAIIDGRYPSPPARELYFISNGAPKKPEVRAFLNWVVTKGQDYVQENGYILLSKSIMDEQVQKLQ